MSCCGSGCGGSCAVCKTLKGLVALLLTLTSIAAFIGVWKTHYVGGAWVFGTQEGSLALLVFIASITLWVKMVTKMCPCHKMMGGGMCPKCGNGPCTCGKHGVMKEGMMK